MSDACNKSECTCRPSRRDVVKLAALGVAAALTSSLPAMAGPFDASDFDKLVPADKKLSADWLNSLTARGQRTVYRGSELKLIGMPVGGLCAGQLYLGGDGSLWHWDIFNEQQHTDAAHYAKPLVPQSPVEQGFTLKVTRAGKSTERSLDAKGFKDVSFCGEYPIGFVEYRDEDSPIEVSLDAFSPFIPLSVDDSSLPATVLRFTLKNASKQKVDVELTGRLQNAVCLHNGIKAGGARKNRVDRDAKLLFLECSAVPLTPRKEKIEARPAIVFADFDGPDYGNWKVEGEAFGKAPAQGATTGAQRLSGFQGKGLANSLLGGSDKPQGVLTSPPFKIERSFINFLIGGGNHPGQTCINLLVDDKIARTETGKDSDEMQWASWDVRELEGKSARLEIVDRHTGGWGHIDIDQIEFADAPRYSLPAFFDLPDYGTMALSLLEPAELDDGNAAIDNGAIERPMNEKLIGSLTRQATLDPGAIHTATFVISWRFPNQVIKNIQGGVGRHYATRFKSAVDVARYIAEHWPRLYDQTKLWHDTWYDSTLPYWFLDRTLLNASILATSTAQRFANGRFWGWEGVGCCEGTCTHVWQYEQAMGRLFPQLDVLLRERCDFVPGVGFHSDTGIIGHRGEHLGPAVDGQAGTILRAYRDHQTSADSAFLQRKWPTIRKAVEWLIQQDANADGILEGAQHNTLDTEWFGPVAWLSGLYLASLRAAEEMATDAADPDFAARCHAIFEKGQKRFVDTLFNGEYFINHPDPKHPEAINSGSGCEIDQVFGQSWAWQVALGRILPQEQTLSALRSLWRYNFTPDVGPYRAVHKPGRWYAMPGEAGLLMCTFPKSDWDYDKAKGKGPQWAAGYFNECMNGFEYQVAGHMIWEGMVQEGLSVARAIHDRYHPSRRNPWNEVECGDHYARSMASYGLFTAACGFEYHGPKGRIAFAPRLGPDDFKSAFTAAEGWGTFAQKRDGKSLHASIQMKYGKLRLNELALELPGAAANATVAVDGRPLAAALRLDGRRATISLAAELTLTERQRLTVTYD